MNKRDRAILIGLVLGDGHISYRTRLKDGKYRYEQAELIIGHSPAQRGYIEHKAELIQSILGGNKPKVSTVYHTLKTTGKTYEGLRLAKTNPYFRILHKEIYENKKKKLTTELLEKCDAHTLALFYMDDGSILHNKNKAGEITSLNFRICTQFEAQEEADIFLKWLTTFGIDAKKFMSKGKWDVGGATQATLVLALTIQEYMVPSMAYKLLPVTSFVIRKSAGHPNFKVDEDIVRSIRKETDRSKD